MNMTSILMYKCWIFSINFMLVIFTTLWEFDRPNTKYWKMKIEEILDEEVLFIIYIMHSNDL